MALPIYVDDIVLIGDNIDEMARVKEKLAANFEIKDFGFLRYFLGMEIDQSKKGNHCFPTKIYSRTPERNWNEWL